MTITLSTIKDDIFGDCVDVPMPEGTDVVIVCRNEGHGLLPMWLRLPHQIYTKDVQYIFATYPGTSDVVLIPARAKDYARAATATLRMRVSECRPGDLIEIGGHEYRLGETRRNGLANVTPTNGGRLVEVNALNTFCSFVIAGGAR